MEHSNIKSLGLRFLATKFTELSKEEVEIIWEDLEEYGQDVIMELRDTINLIKEKHKNISDDNILRIMLNNIERGS